MGTKLSTSLEDWLHPEVSPRADRPTTFDPQAGFTKGRKERKMIATTEEMDRWQLPYGSRNYCAHHLIDVKKCQAKYAPFISHPCWDLMHVYEQCHYQEELVRVKEYERERRLLKRRQRKLAAARAAAEIPDESDNSANQKTE
ncbi:NADH-ubiquinone oxidoreductase b18 subunit (NDUFB7) domain-containing protein [Ditylenchus destructor]|uniref:NADH dehydrogenase [ubiquinone] 1 beta subcomplex subunit 7 n=1 Tax=Ditylenchus destructor TaxID=166010 RepID=A0AAD4MP44_9BILA|nr:NADH-ubiquinone oxidoreductase b18 subunit (NDUFB7) domain-containing protein [Ditylenchus destructor]